MICSLALIIMIILTQSIILLLIIMRQDDLKKKRSQKRGYQVPVQELGFKAKIYYGIETEYTRRRVRYKAVKYGAESSKESFMARLRFTLDATSLTQEDLQNLANFKGIRKQEWSKIKHIVYHSKEQLNCPICLQQTFRAPQMTSCGHIFCWHCIYMHYYKSLKANHCPVCNQALQLQALVTCMPIFSKSFPELKENKVHFTLMARRDNDNRIYNPETLNEILSFGRIVKALPEKILIIYKEQLKAIEQHSNIQQDAEIKTWIEKVHAACWEKIDKLQQSTPKKQYKLHRKQRLQNGVIHTVLDEKYKNSLVTFYQEASGRLIFLHPICEKYLRKSERQLPKELTQEIIYWQEAEYNIDLLKRYRNISHITINEEIDFIIINMDRLIQETLLVGFHEEFQNFKEKKKEELEKQEKQAEKLAIRYEEQKQYLAKLKKMQESEFYDIRVPVTIDPNEIGNTTFFPSLIQTRSLPQQTQQSPKMPEKQKNSKPSPKIIKEQDFPGLNLAPKQVITEPVIIQPPLKLLNIKSEQNTSNTFTKQKNDFPVLQQLRKQQSQQGGKRKKKKQKFVNVTDMFFKDRQQEF